MGGKTSKRKKRYGEWKKEKKRETLGRQGGGVEVHLGELLVIFRPDLYVSPALACLSSTTCFLFVPVDLLSP